VSKCKVQRNILCTYLCLSLGEGFTIINCMKQDILKKVVAPELVKKFP